MTAPNDLRPLHLLPVAAQMIGQRKLCYRSTIGHFPPYIRLFPNSEPMWSLSAVKKFLAAKGEKAVTINALASFEALIDDINKEEVGAQ